jgi:hypothetical protein
MAMQRMLLHDADLGQIVLMLGPKQMWMSAGRCRSILRRRRDRLLRLW